MRPVAEPDLLDHPPLQWPGFAGEALRAGVRSAFSFPLQAGTERLGAFTVYQTVVGALDEGRYADALVMSGVITRSILGLQAGASDAHFAAGLFQGRVDVVGVHQATGMVSAQLHIGVGEAMACMRAHAFATSTTVQQVAAQVISQNLQISI